MLTFKDHGGRVAFSLDGRRIACQRPGREHEFNTVAIVNADSGEEVLALKPLGGIVTSLAFSPNGKQLVVDSAGPDYAAHVFDAASGEKIHTLKGHAYFVNTVAFSPDGKRIATGSGDQTIKIWDASSGQEIRTLKGHESIVTGVAFSPATETGS